MSLLVLDKNIICLVGATARVSIAIEDNDGNLIDPYMLKLRILDEGSQVKFEETWVEGVPGRIKRASVGKFYADFGNQTPNTETKTPAELMFNWEVQVSETGQITYSLQKFKVISARVAGYLPEFRLMIDKARKLIDINNDCFLGYTDGQLLSYLEGGVQTINAYQPSVTMDLENFPSSHRQILLESALVTGVTSQQLFAIDTDIPNYSDQGVSFVISHQPQLASFLNQMTQKLDKLIPMMKLQFINSGSIHVQLGPNFRLTQLVQASPSGALFRNMFFRG